MSNSAAAGRSQGRDANETNCNMKSRNGNLVYELGGLSSQYVVSTGEENYRPISLMNKI